MYHSTTEFANGSTLSHGLARPVSPPRILPPASRSDQNTSKNSRPHCRERHRPFRIEQLLVDAVEPAQPVELAHRNDRCNGGASEKKIEKSGDGHSSLSSSTRVPVLTDSHFQLPAIDPARALPRFSLFEGDQEPIFRVKTWE